MLMFVILTVFIAGLMVGRTPEYLGKKIEARGDQMGRGRGARAVRAASCIGTAIACVRARRALATLNNQGPHGLSEVLYAFTSAAANNGSAFAGIGVNNDFYNYVLAVAMFIGRFAIIVPVLAIAGSMAAQEDLAADRRARFRRTGATFALLLIARRS